MALKPQELMAMVLLAERTMDVPGLSQRIAEALNRGIKVEPILIKRVPGGYWSEDAALFIRLLFGTRLTDKKRSSLVKITLSEEGVEFCRQLVLEAYQRDPKMVEKAAKELGLVLSDLIG